jgi:hypothetical protein
VLIILAAWALSSAPGFAASIPFEAGAFTAYVAGLLQKAEPDAKITIVSPLTLDVKAPTGASTAYLGAIHDACRRDRDQCASFVSAYVTASSDRHHTATAPVALTDLRVVVRPSVYVAQIREAAVRAGGQPVAAPLVGDLWVVGAADTPDTIRLLNTNLLTPTGLSPEEAMDRGRKNMRAQMRKLLKPAAEQPRGVIGGLTGDPYMSSLMAFPELWAKVADAMGGNLIVAAPATDVVLFSDGSASGAAAALAAAARQVMAQAERPFSADVFRWSSGGWVAVPVRGH